MENKVITAALAISIALISWSLTTTVGLKTDVALLKEKVTQIEKALDKKSVSKKKPKKKKKKKKQNNQ